VVTGIASHRLHNCDVQHRSDLALRHRLMLAYRKEIDGIRALAVSAVVLHHAGASALPGGYIGVDVFFVISGYLITSLILADAAAGQFSLVTFYERRMRRIIPALLCMLLICCLVFWLLLAPADLLYFTNSLIATSLFLSNFFFARFSGYFAPEAEQTPLLHTWSLSIEEQFYLLYPLLCLWLLRHDRRLLVAALLLLFTGSLVSAHYWQATPARFFLTPLRLWELLAGCLLALWRPGSINACWLRQTIGVLALALLVGCLFLLDRTAAWPGLLTLLPIAATVTLLAVTQAGDITYRLLTTPPLPLLGLMSYSLYLWHQPLLALLRLKTVGEPEPLPKLLALTLAFALAYLSWRFIERPARRRHGLDRRLLLAGFLIGTSGLIGFGVGSYLSEGYAGRFAANPLAASAVSSPMRQQCHTKGSDYLPPAQACRYFGEQIDWAIFGDSHVVEPGLALAEQLAPQQRGLLHLSFSDCPPALAFTTNLPGCSQWLHESLQLLVNEHSIRHVLVGFRHSYHLYGNHATAYPALPQLDPARIVATPANIDGQRTEQLYWQGFSQLIEQLRQAGKTVYVLFPVPEVPLNIHQAIHPFSVLNTRPLLDLERSSSMAYYRHRHRFILGKLEQLNYDESLIAIKPTDVLCTRDHCRVAGDAAAYYFDDDHLSVAGARLLIDHFF
jgi:peptidoglycan/LPS O-acetylase OafA/YrhL